MKVSEQIILADGRRVTVDMTHEEWQILMSHAINLFISAGMMKIDEQPKTFDQLIEAEKDDQQEAPSIFVPGSETLN